MVRDGYSSQGRELAIKIDKPGGGGIANCMTLGFFRDSNSLNNDLFTYRCAPARIPKRVQAGIIGWSPLTAWLLRKYFCEKPCKFAPFCILATSLNGEGKIFESLVLMLAAFVM
jgi:hypothetical protein